MAPFSVGVPSAPSAPLTGTPRFHRHGLYEMPSLCVQLRRLGNQRVVPCFRSLFSVDMSPSEIPGSRSAAHPQFLHRPRWPLTLWDGLGTSNTLHPPILVEESNFGTYLRFAYVMTCRLARPPVGADQAFAQPTGTFTSGLSTDWSPAPPPNITTVATGKVPLAGLTPARTSTSIAAAHNATYASMRALAI